MKRHRVALRQSWLIPKNYRYKLDLVAGVHPYDISIFPSLLPSLEGISEDAEWRTTSKSHPPLCPAAQNCASGKNSKESFHWLCPDIGALH